MRSQEDLELEVTTLRESCREATSEILSLRQELQEALNVIEKQQTMLDVFTFYVQEND